MRFFAFQKKPLFNRGFRREILKVAIFDPPRKPPEKNPTFWPFWPFWTPLLGSLFDPFLTPQKTPENPKNDPFWPPPKTDPPPKILENGPFGENRGFQARFEPQKGGGGGGLPRDPPKKAIFGHFWPFLPFLAIFAIFGHFWPLFDPPKWSPNLAAKCERNWRFLAKKGRKPPQKPPWPDRLYLIIGLLGRKFGICAENEDFSAPPQVREKCEWIWPQFTHYYANIFNNIIKLFK